MRSIDIGDYVKKMGWRERRALKKLIRLIAKTHPPAPAQLDRDEWFAEMHRIGGECGLSGMPSIDEQGIAEYDSYRWWQKAAKKASMTLRFAAIVMVIVACSTGGVLLATGLTPIVPTLIVTGIIVAFIAAATSALREQLGNASCDYDLKAQWIAWGKPEGHSAYDDYRVSMNMYRERVRTRWVADPPPQRPW